jgi:hypothetical protein
MRLDHKYSKKQGFLDEIPTRIIGSLVNLELISQSENCSKKCKCSITKEELLTNYQIYENKKNN